MLQVFRGVGGCGMLPPHEKGMDMKVLILGVGDAFTRRSFGSSALIRTQAGLILLDCPDLIHRAIAEAGERSGWPINATDVTDIIITHLHGDHCNGLESMGFYRARERQGDPARTKPRLHTTQPVLARLWERLAPAMDAFDLGGGHMAKLEDFFDLRPMSPNVPADIAGLAVRCRFTKHPIPTIGLLLSNGKWTLGWSGDTAFDRDHIDWLSEADVIVHESNLGPVHTPIESLNTLPESLRKKMRLIHLPDDFDPGATDIAVLREGEELLFE